jgi:hypothetical protein
VDGNNWSGPCGTLAPKRKCGGTANTETVLVVGVENFGGKFQ